MIVGADAATDAAIVTRAATLYDRFGLRRVYYSAFSPIPDASAVLPLGPPAADARAPALPGRLDDALLRLFERRGGGRGGAGRATLPLDIDPKLAWALKHRDFFPLDVNRAPREALLRDAGPRREGGRPHPRGACATAGCGSTTSAG